MLFLLPAKRRLPVKYRTLLLHAFFLRNVAAAQDHHGREQSESPFHGTGVKPSFPTGPLGWTYAVQKQMSRMASTAHAVLTPSNASCPILYEVMQDTEVDTTAFGSSNPFQSSSAEPHSDPPPYESVVMHDGGVGYTSSTSLTVALGTQLPLKPATHALHAVRMAAVAHGRWPQQLASSLALGVS